MDSALLARAAQHVSEITRAFVCWLRLPASSWFVDLTWDSRNRLTAVDAYNGADPNVTASPFTARDRDFAFDLANNRDTSAQGGGGNTTYATNSLNQYTHINPPSGPNEPQAYDADRNLTDNSTWTFTYDAENRVTVIEPAAAPGARDANDVKLEFKYDHLNRRVEKKVTAWDPTAGGGSGDWEASPTTHLKYGYDGDELVIEYNGLNSDSVERRYRWALGKLWWMRKLIGARYVMMRDVQDNVTMLVKRTGLAVEGIYEYDALGNVLSVAGAYGEDNPMRWGSAYRDSETGFVANRGGLTDLRTGRVIGKIGPYVPTGYRTIPCYGACPPSVPIYPGDSSSLPIPIPRGNNAGSCSLGNGALSQCVPAPVIGYVGSLPYIVWAALNPTLAIVRNDYVDCDSLAENACAAAATVSSAFGKTWCIDGVVCACTNGGSIENQLGEGNPANVTETARGVATLCTQAHEARHIQEHASSTRECGTVHESSPTADDGSVLVPTVETADSSNHCNLQAETFQCIETSAQMCQSEPDAQTACRCFRQLAYYVGIVPCGGDQGRSGHVSCSPQDQTACTTQKTTSIASIRTMAAGICPGGITGF